MKLSCLPCCMLVRLGQSAVVTQSSWTSSAWDASGNFSMLNGRTGSQIWRFSREQKWWAYIQYSRDPSWDGEGMCVVCLISACQRGCSMVSQKQADTSMKAKRTTTKHTESLPEELWHKFWHLGGSWESLCYLAQPDQYQGDCLWRW